MPTVLVTGANRGLGLEFTRQYLADGWDVIAVCRNPGSAQALAELGEGNNQLEILAADLSDLDAIDTLATEISDRPIDLLLNNAGVFGPKRRADGDYRQTFGQIDYDAWLAVLRINTLAPLKLAESLFGNVMTSDKKIIVTISSQLGSIGEGESALYAYRTSKAAVNMAMATLSREAEASGAIVVTFNPGWVKTDMGGDDAVLTPEDSVSSVREQIESLTPADSGAFIDYDGRRIPW